MAHLNVFEGNLLPCVKKLLLSTTAPPNLNSYQKQQSIITNKINTGIDVKGEIILNSS